VIAVAVVATRLVEDPGVGLHRPVGRSPGTYRENRWPRAAAASTLQALTRANDAEDVRVDSTKLKDHDIEG
jgi:hypothetical protein